MGIVRFASIGTSGICERFLESLALVEGASYVAAYSRSLERATSFGERFGAHAFFDDLDALASSPEVDAVYIASPNGLHADQALRMIRGGKHVLIEKPLASNEAEARRVFEAARSQGVNAMEAMRNLHVPSFGVIERVCSSELGAVRRATLRFSKVTSRMARLRAGERLNIFDPSLSGGALMDIGVYCVEPAIALFGRPTEIRSLSVTVPAPGVPQGDACATIDLAGEALLGYDDKIVSLSYGKMSDDLLPSQVEGELGTLLWDQTSCPVNPRIHLHEDKGLIFRMEGMETRDIPVDVPEDDMVCEIGDFIAAVRGSGAARGLCERLEGVTVDSLAVMDEIRRQAGVRFPADDRAS